MLVDLRRWRDAKADAGARTAAAYTLSQLIENLYAFTSLLLKLHLGTSLKCISDIVLSQDAHQ